VSPLTEAEIEMIKDTFIPKKIRKRQYFLQEGQVCRYAAFLVKGAMRQYTIDDKGMEHIVRLFVEDWWPTDRLSWMRQTPAEYNIDAWEDSDVLLLSIADYQNRLMSIPAIAETTIHNYERFVIETQKRVASIGLSADERYAELAKMYPEFLQRFPQHIIASYLGIAKETLSRLRGSVARK